MSKTIPMWSQDYPTWTLRVGSLVALIVRRVKRSAAFRGDDEFAWVVGSHKRKGPAEWLHRGVATTIFEAQQQAEKAMRSVRMLFNAPVRWERVPGMGENRMWRRPAGSGYLYIWIRSNKFPQRHRFVWEVWTGARGAPSGTASSFKEAASMVAVAYKKHLEKGGAMLFNRKNADPRFEALAEAQRGKPEGAMMRLQMAQISQLYGVTAEHVGDLTHRMSQRIDFFKGGYGWVSEKVKKTLGWLTNPYGFEREVKEQVVTNFNYYKELQAKGGRPFPKHFGRSPQDALLRLKRLGRLYAAEHRKLPVFNAVQRIARAAAIAVGEWRFKDAVDRLHALKYLLDQGHEVWAREAMKTKNNPRGRKRQIGKVKKIRHIEWFSPYRRRGESPRFGGPSERQIEARAKMSAENRLKRKPRNPWAICAAAGLKPGTAKYERCVMKVKAKMNPMSEREWWEWVRQDLEYKPLEVWRARIEQMVHAYRWHKPPEQVRAILWSMRPKVNSRRVRRNLHVDLPTSEIFTSSPYGLTPNARRGRPRLKTYYVARFRPPYPQRGEFWTANEMIDLLPATVVGGVYKISAPNRVLALAQAKAAHARGR